MSFRELMDHVQSIDRCLELDFTALHLSVLVQRLASSGRSIDSWRSVEELPLGVTDEAKIIIDEAQRTE
jgi:hypothetical protein